MWCDCNMQKNKIISKFKFHAVDILCFCLAFLAQPLLRLDKFIKKKKKVEEKKC